MSVKPEKTFRINGTKEHSIIFSIEMVRAIIEKRKTQTRRIVKPQPEDHMVSISGVFRHPKRLGKNIGARELVKCPYGKPEDRLWVKETFGFPGNNEEEGIVYRATDTTWDEASIKDCPTMLWKSPLFMPREYSRILLEVVSVKTERLQDISEEDAKAEGVAEPQFAIGVMQERIGGSDYNIPVSLRGGFVSIWDKINKDYCWSKNPWVWVIEFKKIN